MSETNATPQPEKSAKIRRKAEGESVLQPTFAAARYGATGDLWDRDQPGTGLLQRQCACGKHTIGGGECDDCRRQNESGFLQRAVVKSAAHSTPPGDLVRAKIQPKLTVNTPGDIYEQEADAVADQVMRLAEPESSPVRFNQSASGERIQRLAANQSPSLEDVAIVEGGEESEGEQVQTLRPLGQAGGRETISRSLLNNSQGGVPLGSSVRRFMEPRFGTDFSQVQVHTDRQANILARSLSARAFAHGQHIYFNEGEYQPETHQGKHVLAHELTHVVQQTGYQTQLPVRRHLSGDKGEKVSTLIQRLTRPGRELKHNVAPWGGSGPTGTNYEVSTDGGSIVTGWIAYSPWQHHLQYWCHGHSLDTFYQYGYSVYSGLPLETTLVDEWDNIDAAQTQAGDIAVWTAGYNHSAKFTEPVIEGGWLVRDRSMLSTKNGQSPVAIMSLAEIMDIYGTAGVAVFRHK